MVIFFQHFVNPTQLDEIWNDMNIDDTAVFKAICLLGKFKSSQKSSRMNAQIAHNIMILQTRF